MRSELKGMAVTGVGYREDLKLALDHRTHGPKVEYSNYTLIYSRAAKAGSYSRRLQDGEPQPQIRVSGCAIRQWYRIDSRYRVTGNIGHRLPGTLREGAVTARDGHEEASAPVRD
jgi:hypothetical protein